MNMSSLKSFDWRSLQKFANPKVAEDINVFLEKLPQNTSKTLLIITGVIWAFAGAIGLYTTVQLNHLTEMRAQWHEAEVLKPIVPMVKDVPVDRKEVTQFVEKFAPTYGGLKISAEGPSIVITAESTGYFGQFREAIGHIQNGGSGWRVNIDRLCVGRECKPKPLTASLKINKVSVNKPG